MLSENLYPFEENVYELINHPKTDLNLKNEEGQTALGQLLSDSQYKNQKLVTMLIEDKRININQLDNQGNNYLQLLIISSNFQIEEIAFPLHEKKLVINHKNNNNQSVLDLVIENKVQRTEFRNKIVLLELNKLYPELLFEHLQSGKTLLYELLSSKEYPTSSELNALVRMYKNSNLTQLFKSEVSECFTHYLNHLISEESILSLTKALSEENMEIDANYCFAIIAITSSRITQTNINEYFKSISLVLDIPSVIDHIKHLTKDDSKEQSQAIDYLIRFRFRLNSFDAPSLQWEEKSIEDKYKLNNQRTDTINLGHLEALDGFLKNDNESIELTGNPFTNSVTFLIYLMNSYISYCQKSGRNLEYLEGITKARNMIVKARRYYFLFTKQKNLYPPTILENELFFSMVEDSQGTGISILSGWPGHAILIIIIGENLYRINGGSCSTDTAIEHYKITKKEEISTALFKNLYNSFEETNKSYIQEHLHSILGLRFLRNLPGPAQTVGNCSFHSALLSLRVQYQLFLPETIIDELYADTLGFFKNFARNEYFSRYPNSPITNQLILRLIIQKLLPNNELEKVKELLTEHFSSKKDQEILREELMIARWNLIKRDLPRENFDSQMKFLNISLNTELTERLELLYKILTNQISIKDLENLSTEPLFQGYTPLYLAVANNNLRIVSFLIKKFPESINRENWYHKNPLQASKSVKMTQFLVMAGADLNSTEIGNPLDCAITTHNLNLVLKLLEYDAPCSQKSMYLAGTTDPQILQALMDKYPTSIQNRTYDYSLAVHAAAMRGVNENLQRAIYYGGLNPDSPDVNGITPIQHALKHHHKHTAKLLIEYSRIFRPPHRGDSIADITKDKELQMLLELKQLDHQTCLEYFQKFKKNLQSTINEGIDYLIIALRVGESKAVKGCLLAFPDLIITNISKLYLTTPLAEAAYQISGKEGEALHVAFETIKLLLRTPKVDLNARMANSKPHLFLPTTLNSLELLELFLADPKLNPNLKDDNGQTALDDALARDHNECADLLLNDPRVEYIITNDMKIA